MRKTKTCFTQVPQHKMTVLICHLLSKAFSTWLMEGDKNTIFFMQNGNCKMNAKYIYKLKVDGLVIEFLNSDTKILGSRPELNGQYALEFPFPKGSLNSQSILILFSFLFSFFKGRVF